MCLIAQSFRNPLRSNLKLIDLDVNLGCNLLVMSDCHPLLIAIRVLDVRALMQGSAHDHHQPHHHHVRRHVQALLVDPDMSVEVERGDTLYAIAREHEVT